MRLNTTKSMKLARRVKGKFGSWQAVRDASRREDGIYVVQPKKDPSDHPHVEMKQPVTA